MRVGATARVLGLALAIVVGGCAGDQPAATDGAVVDRGAPDVGADQRAVDADADVTVADGRADRSSSTDGADPGDGRVDALAPQPDAGVGWLLAPAASCSAGGNPCSAAAVSGLFASYRKDAWLSQYVEPGAPPLSGGRFQIAGLAQASGTVARVKVDGVDLEQALADPSVKDAANPVEWFHVWPKQVQKGEPIWVAFHSRAASWDSATQGKLSVETAAGAALLAGSFDVAQPKVPLTYVTTSEDGKTLLVHLQNRDTVAHTITGVIVDGRDVSAVKAPCVGQQTLGPGEATLITLPLCQAKKPGDPWTVVVELAQAPPSVGVGRTIPPFFPIESYTTTTQCPFPNNPANYQQYVQAGLDTTYIHGGTAATCGYDTKTLLEVELPKTPLRALCTHSVGDNNSFQNLERVAGWETGDESDGKIYEDGKPAAWNKAQKSRALWDKTPAVPTFNGAKTNKNVGTFAGMADIQGIDFYVAACAPHITQVFTKFELTTAYDYLRNARENQMPQPTWLYTQGLSPVWNATQPLTGVKIHVQPDPQELLIQGMSAVLAGGKGLMWFQVNHEEAKHAPARWQAISELSWLVRGVRHLLREGDLTGMAKGNADVLTDAIRARDAIVVPLVDIKVNDRVDDSCNALKYISEASVPHWTVHPIQASVTITVPPDFGVREIFEVKNRKATLASYATTIKGRELTISGIPLDNSTPVRMLVLARDASVRAVVTQALK